MAAAQRANPFTVMPRALEEFVKKSSLQEERTTEGSSEGLVVETIPAAVEEGEARGMRSTFLDPNFRGSCYLKIIMMKYTPRFT